MLPLGVFVFIQNCSFVFIEKCNSITFSLHWVKTKWRFFSSFIWNQFSKLRRFIFLTVSPRDKPSFYSLTKPTFKLCFLGGVVKTCLPWNFIAFLNLKCWWEKDKGKYWKVFSRNMWCIEIEFHRRYKGNISCRAWLS